MKMDDVEGEEIEEEEIITASRNDKQKGLILQFN